MATVLQIDHPVKKVIDDKWWNARPAEAPEHFSLSVDQKTRLCQTCCSVFGGERELEKEYSHHRSLAYLERSANAGCQLCKITHQMLSVEEEQALRTRTHESEEYGTPIFFQICLNRNPNNKTPDFQQYELQITYYGTPTQGLDWIVRIHRLILMPIAGM
jgi:hypothetical protein